MKASESFWELFWAKVNKGAGCWEWTAAITTPQGYGSFKGSKSGLTRYAHRLSWEFSHGPIPKGMSILHRCGNRACVRPEHLYAGTKSDNMKDAAQDGTLRTVKLTVSQVREIKSRFEPGCSYRLADEFGVCPETIMNIVHGKTWKRFNEPLLSQAEEAQLTTY